MGKREARARIYAGKVTLGHLRHYVEMAAMDADHRPARVNSSLTKQQAWNIFTASLNADTRDDSTLIDGRRTRDLLMATNILREFGPSEIERNA